jgi:hypothetical protein
MKAAMSFSMLYFSMAWVATSTASCCISSVMSAFLITAFRSDIFFKTLTKEREEDKEKVEGGEEAESGVR